jgi:heme oxygenase
MLSEKIKEETKQNHQLLEKKLVAFMRGIRSEQDYVQLLTLFYGFFGGLELAIDAQLDHSQLPDYKLRRKTAALAEDLAQFGKTAPPLAHTDELPGINNHLQALGALYVIEGSTLGGTIISKMIKQQLAIVDNQGLSFFNGYGEKTEKMWQDFKTFLNEPLKPGEATMVIRSANDTFKKFSQWFDMRPL